MTNLIPPVNTDSLIQEWEKDSQINDTELGSELLKISRLHSKYLRILTHHNLMVKKLNIDINVMRKIKWQYYSGDLNNPDDIEKYNIEPIGKKILRQDIPTYLDGDEDLNKILAKKIINQEIVDFCTSVLKELNSRTYQLRSAIEYEKFIGGSIT